MKNPFKSFLYNFSKKFIAKTIINSENILTPEYLLNKGWIKEGEYYIEPGIKDRDRISVSFEDHHYRVFHSRKLVFVALESKVEWFDIYYLLMNPDSMYDIAGI